MIPVIVTILGFVLSGIVGNQLLQRWQYRSWLRQQKFSGAEKEYIALRDLIADISKECGKRLFRMRRLLYSVGSGDFATIDQRLSSYDESLVSWNEQFNGLAAKLTVFGSFSETKRLEREIQQPFHSVGVGLERLVRIRRSGESIDSNHLKTAERQLQSIQIKISIFDRDMLYLLQDRRKKTYYGYYLKYDYFNLEKMSNSELIHALFVSDVDGHTIARAP